MKSIVAAILLLTAFAAPVFAQPGAPEGWKLGGSNPKGYQTGTAAVAGMQGRQAAWIKAEARAAADGFGNLMQTVRAENYRGKAVRFSARLMGENPEGLQMWLGAEDAAGQTLDLAASARVSGNTTWQPVDVVQKIPEKAETIGFGIQLQGSRGRGWIDAARFEVLEGDAAQKALKQISRSKIALRQQATLFSRCNQTKAVGGRTPMNSAGCVFMRRNAGPNPPADAESAARAG